MRLCAADAGHHKTFSPFLTLPTPQKLPELINTITPPKGVKAKTELKPGSVPDDEGCELIDCEGEEIQLVDEPMEQDDAQSEKEKEEEENE